jgi:hypothetical protein
MLYRPASYANVIEKTKQFLNGLKLLPKEVFLRSLYGGIYPWSKEMIENSTTNILNDFL